MIHEQSDASFTFIAYSKSKVTEFEKSTMLPLLAYSCVQINAHRMVTVSRFLRKICKK